MKNSVPAFIVWLGLMAEVMVPAPGYALGSAGEPAGRPIDFNADSILPVFSGGYGMSRRGFSAEVGRIAGDDRYGWGQCLGWIDFRGEEGGLKIGGNILAGWISIEKAGLVCLGSGRPRDGFQYSNSDYRDYGVNNDGQGNLSGWGWGANFGWINFHGVRIDRNGNFTGAAYSSKIGYICFQSTGPVRYAVRTDPYPWAAIGGNEALRAGRGCFPETGGESFKACASSGPAVPGSCLKFLDALLPRQEGFFQGERAGVQPGENGAIVQRLPGSRVSARGPPVDQTLFG